MLDSHRLVVLEDIQIQSEFNGRKNLSMRFRGSSGGYDRGMYIGGGTVLLILIIIVIVLLVRR